MRVPSTYKNHIQGYYYTAADAIMNIIELEETSRACP
jgi:hypothetical protein